MMNSEYVTAADLDVHLLRSGQGKPLLLLHGWPEHAGVWRRIMSQLDHGYESFAPDFRGFGKTEPSGGGPTGPAGPERLTADIIALLDGLGLEQVGIVSHDVGSFVAQTIALEHPERVSRLFFFNCGYPGIGRRWVEDAHIKESWYTAFHLLPLAEALVGYNRDTMRIYLRHFLSHWSADPAAFSDEDLDEWVDVFASPHKLTGGFNWYRGVWSLREKMMKEGPPPVRAIDHPTRVLWGAADPVLKSAWADRLPDYFTDLRVDILPDAGHFVHWEKPDTAAKAIAEFF